MRSLFRKFHDTVAARVSHRKRGSVPPGEAGVTLVEMIVVLVIIALVAALVVPNVMGRPDQAKATTTKTNLKTISAALKMYRLDNGDYPTTAQGLKALTTKPTQSPIPPNWNPEGYMADVGTDPWGHPYVYEAPAPGGFKLQSLGKDGKPGGTELDADVDSAQ